jgi:hypothetical protein
MNDESVDKNPADVVEQTPGSPAKRVKRQKKTRAPKRTRRTTLFPASSFEEALALPNAIQKYGGGQRVRRLTLFDQIQKSPDSSGSRMLVVNANKYGLVKGNYSSEYLELTPEGKLATGNEIPEADKVKARFVLAIERIAPFKALYDAQVGSRLPASSILEDLAKENGIPPEAAKECVEVFIVNAKFLGILKPIAGAERIIPIEQAMEELPSTPPTFVSSEVRHVADSMSATVGSNGTSDAGNHDSWETTCFYISTIGEEGSEHRLHSDLFLSSLVEPALEEFGLKVIRADKIGKPGMITSQIIEYIFKSKLVVADLSFHNPNVFYELSLRHACRLPTVQIIRKCDKIPFDLDQSRTIPIDTTNIYSMVPNLQTYRAQIATQVRAALKDPDSGDNPITTHCPSLRVSFNGQK